jgi:hypothetical protein
LIFIDQAKDKIGALANPYAAKPETFGGGRSVGYYSSVRVHLRNGAAVKNKNKKEIGTWINFAIDKNKVGVPHRKGSFCLLYDYGIDNVTSNLDFLLEFQEGKKDVSFNGEVGPVEEMVNYVEANKLEGVLVAEVEKAWKEAHATGHNRKREVW